VATINITTGQVTQEYIKEDLSNSLVSGVQTYNTAYKFKQSTLEVHYNGLLLRELHEYVENSNRTSFTFLPEINFVLNDNSLIIKYVRG